MKTGKSTDKSRQSEMKLLPAGRGGWRPNAGRRASPRARVLHRKRERIPGHCPVHVTLRVRRGIPALRRQGFVRAFRNSLRECSARSGFRVIHYSIQNDHLHFLIEAQGREALARGMKSLSARVARCANRVFGRAGKVLDGRFHHRVLRSPREVRNALAYVLLNARHHCYQRHRRRPAGMHIDPASSGRWFDGWRYRPHPDRPEAATRVAVQRSTAASTHAERCGVAEMTARVNTDLHDPEVAAAGTWLLCRGWRRHRLIDPAEVPGTGTAR